MLFGLASNVAKTLQPMDPMLLEQSIKPATKPFLFG